MGALLIIALLGTTPVAAKPYIPGADSDVLEASTPELDDLVRIQDRYGRG
jgi:hypothetical protein